MVSFLSSIVIRSFGSSKASSYLALIPNPVNSMEDYKILSKLTPYFLAQTSNTHPR